MVGTDTDTTGILELRPGYIFKTDSAGKNLKIVHRFSKNDSLNGAVPLCELLMASNGKLYGTTSRGGKGAGNLYGTYGAGTLFEYDPIIDSFKVLVHFGTPQYPNNILPDINLIEGKKGILYGGFSSAQGRGSIFTFNIRTNVIQRIYLWPLIPYQITTLFNGMGNGFTLAKNGRLYNTTGAAVNPGCSPFLGSIFSIDTVTNAYSQRYLPPCLGTDTMGISMCGEMVEWKPGKLITKTNFETPKKAGAILEYDYVTNRMRVLHRFDTLLGNSYLNTMILGRNNKLYGTTGGGGLDVYLQRNGTIFEFDPQTLNYRELHSFGFNGSDSTGLPLFTGYSPSGRLMQGSNRKLYGTNLYGIFEYDIDNQITTLTQKFPLYPTISRGLIEICRKPSYKPFGFDTLRVCSQNTLKVICKSDNALRFQWVKNGISLQGQTDSILQIPTILFSDAGRYHCRLENGCGQTEVRSFYLRVDTIVPPTITQVGNNPFCTGDSLLLISSSLSGNLWSRGDTTQSISVKNSQTIRLRVKSGVCTSAVSVPLVVQVANPGVVNIGPSGGTLTSPTFVSIEVPEGSIALYTLDGSNPQAGQSNTLVYSAPFLLSSTTIVKAAAWQYNCLGPVNAKVFTFVSGMERVATPVLSPPSGNYSSPPSVGISTSTPDAQIYFTTTGNTPVPGTVFTRLYSTPVVLLDTGNIKAMAVKPGLVNSFVVSGFYNISNPGIVKAPVINPGTGTYSGSVVVSISVSTPGATIYYSTSGNLPVPGTGFTRIYTGAFTLFGSTTVRAVAVKSGAVNSPISVANITVINPSVVSPITFSPVPGDFPGPVSISLSTTTSDVQIYFTTNGVRPGNVVNTNCKLYTGPILLSQSRQIKAIGYRPGFQNSVVSVGNYFIGPARMNVESGLEGMYYEQEFADVLSEQLEMGAFPNPSSGLFQIAFSGKKGRGSLDVRNILGKTLIQYPLEADEYTKEINLTQNPGGIYFVQFYDGEKVREIKLVRE